LLPCKQTANNQPASKKGRIPIYHPTVFTNAVYCRPDLREASFVLAV